MLTWSLLVGLPLLELFFESLVGAFDLVLLTSQFMHFYFQFFEC